jgi:hypothetical protein
MPKPLNHKEEGCNPISSNCVIWQGPNIECIRLCTGDTESDVVSKLATELCNVMEILNISTYQDAMACFNLAIGAGAPTNFQQLIELLTARICNLETCTGCTPDCNGDSQMQLPDEVSTPCCDTLVPIADCFYYPDPATGDTVTELGLSAYVHLIGNRICDILAALTTHGISITNLNVRVTSLENAIPPTYTPTPIIPVCVLPAVATDPFNVLVALESQFCALQTATGNPNEIMTEIPTPAGLGSSQQLCGTGTMQSLTGWSNVGGTMAAAIGNMWLTIMDMRCAIINALACCPHGCDGVMIIMTAEIIGTSLKIYFNGTLPTGFTDCNVAGNTFTITDINGNSTIILIRVADYINTSVPYVLDLSSTPVDHTLDITITATACVEDATQGYLCEKYLSVFIANIAPCPSILTAPTDTTIVYSFVSALGSTTYTIQLWSADGSSLITSQTFMTTVVQPVTGTFTVLTPATSYRVRALVTQGTHTTTCPDLITTTASAPCYAPAAVTPTIGIIP